MKENKLLTLSQEFAVEIIKIAQLLKDKKEYGFAAKLSVRVQVYRQILPKVIIHKAEPI